jgi:acetylornithine deacetylase/succinyl-diaminopimelate desuccinylase-like protein
MSSAPNDPRRARRHRFERIAAAILIVVAGAVTAALWLWQKKEGERLRQDLRYVPKQVAITPEIELLREYVRIDTSTPQGVARGAQWLVQLLARSGVKAELIESTPGRFNVYARIRGREPGNALLLFNHIDVVPPGAGWTRPPFEAAIAADTMHGRGTLDMKALALCQLFAFVDVARSGRPPAHDLVFLATADEETGSEHGMRWIIANRPDVLEGVKVGITEGGVTEIISERMTYFGIEIGGKQLVELTLEADAKEPLLRARIALEPHMFPREPHRVIPAVRRYFASIAPTRLAFAPYLADIDKTIAEGEFWRLPAPYRDLAQNSLQVHAPRRSGDGWSMDVKQVNLPDESPEARIEWLRRQVAPYGVRIGRVVSKQGPVPSSSEETPLFRVLAEEASRRFDVRAGVIVLYRSTSDSRFLRPLGIDCYGVSPFRVPYFQSLSIHGTNERIRIDYFLEGIDYLRSVVRTWAASADN